MGIAELHRRTPETLPASKVSYYTVLVQVEDLMKESEALLQAIRSAMYVYLLLPGPSSRRCAGAPPQVRTAALGRDDHIAIRAFQAPEGSSTTSLPVEAVESRHPNPGCCERT